jgi:hypothetical protein
MHQERYKRLNCFFNIVPLRPGGNMHFSVTLRIFNCGPGGTYLELSGILENASSNLRILRDAKVHYPLAAKAESGHPIRA